MLIFFVLLSALFLVEEIFCLFFLCLFFFFFFFFEVWAGLFIINFNSFFFSLVFLSILILVLLFMTEGFFILKLFSAFLVFFCVFFFMASNLFFLYIFFELSIFPILLMILGFGAQVEKVSAGYYLFFYSSFCSLPFLVVLFNLNLLSLSLFFSFNLSWEFCFFVFFLFLMKFPVYFLHLWLPKAHVEAPTSASMLLAGLLLKLGTGGFLRTLSLLKLNFDYFLIFVSFLGFVLSCFMCLLQSDLKALAAYSSINHMMFLLFVFVNLSVYSLFSCVAIMVAHGFVSTLMFFFVGEFYHAVGTRMLYFLGGYLKVSLYFLVFFTLTWLFNSGVPPSLSFFSELLGLGVLFNISFFIFFLGLLYFFLSFYYSVYIVLSAFLGKSVLELLYWNSYFCFFFCFGGEMFSFLIFFYSSLLKSYLF